MRAVTLFAEEAQRMGFTELFFVEHTDFNSAVVGAQTITLTPLAIGDLVGPELLVECPVTWDLGNANLEVGVTATVNYFITSTSLLGSDPIYKSVAATVAPYLATAATNLVAKLDAVDSAPNQAAQGQLRIWARISRKARREIQA